MSERKPRAKRVKVGDQVDVEKGSDGLAVLPDGTVVTCRNVYTVQHVGRHVIGGVAYVAEAAQTVVSADPADPEV